MGDLSIEARNAFCRNRAIELYGPPAENLRRAAVTGISRLIARLDMLNPDQVDLSTFARGRTGGVQVSGKGVTTSSIQRWLSYQDDCGTAACVAGWATIEALQFGDGNTKAFSEEDGPVTGYTEDFAAKFMGLSKDEAYALFFPKGYAAGKKLYTLDSAKAVLRHLWKTGIVNWSFENER